MLVNRIPAANCIRDDMQRNNSNVEDQRGTARPQNANCDVGAFEAKEGEVPVPAPAPQPAPKVISVCGNKIVEGLERCDDGNLISGDGCDKTCQKELIAK